MTGRHAAPGRQRSRAWLWWSLAIVLAGILDLTLAHGASRMAQPPPVPVVTVTPCPAPVGLVPHVSLHIDFPARNFAWSCFP